MATFTNYVKTLNSPTVYGITSGGQAVAFENQDQFLNSGGNFSNVKTVPQVTNAINYSQWNKPMTSVPMGTPPPAAPQINGPAAPALSPLNTSVPTPSYSTPSTPAVSVNPSPVTDTQQLSQTPTTSQDIQAQLDKLVANQNDFFQNKVPSYIQGIQAAGQVSPEEQVLQQKQAQYNAQVNEAAGQASGMVNPDNQAIPLEFLQGQGRTKLFMAQNAAALNQAQLQYAQGNREIAYNTAKDVFNSNLQAVQAGTQNVGTLMDLYLKTAPQNVGTQYNPVTGDLYAVMRDPFSGNQSVQNLGNIGAQKSYLSTDIKTLPDGSMVMIGTKADGTVDVKPISDAAGNITQGSSGAITDQGGGSIGDGTLGSLLGYYVNGNTAQLPGNGYQQAVYQKTGASANTPISQVNPYQLADAIATAEGSPKLAAATNNPYAILWSTAQAVGLDKQFGATPYKASNGYTYAKFNSPALGQQAMVNYLQNYVYPKIAAPKTASTQVNPTAVQNVIQQGQVTPDIVKTVVNSLPPALQQATRYLPDGTPFLDGSQLTDSAQITMAQTLGSRYGIPYINKDDAQRLNTISATLNQLQDYKQFADQHLKNAVPGLTGLYLKTTGLLGSSARTQFNSRYATALNSIQSLASGMGSGFRMTQSEIDTATSNLPTIWDTQAQADAKIQTLQQQMYEKIQQSIPEWQPPQ